MSSQTIKQEIILKPTGTVYISNKFSLVERKLLNGLIWHSQQHRFSKEKNTISLKTVFQFIGLESSRNYDVIKDALLTLIGTVIEWNMFGDDRTTVWGACTFLAGAEVQRGELSYIINPALTEKINTPTLFAKIQLLIQSQFRRRHTLVLYEFIVDFMSRHKADRATIDDISIEKIYKLLGIGDDEYQAFKEFNRKVLKPSAQEINDFSDIAVQYKTIRKGRKVAALQFIVEKKDSVQLFFDFKKEDSLGQAAPAPATDLTEEQRTLVDQLTDKGVGVRQAKKLVETYPSDRIRANIDLMSQKQAGGKQISNPAAYLVRAIEDDYRPKKSPEQIRQEKAASKRQAAQEAKCDQRQLEKEWEVLCTKRVKEHFAAKPLAWQETKRQEFVAKIKQEAASGNSVLYQRFQKEQFASVMVESCFFSGLKEELLSRPEETDFEQYLAWREQQAAGAASGHGTF